jgi:hypothetical protein
MNEQLFPTPTGPETIKALIDKAFAAGRKAAVDCTPVPMGVTDGRTTWVIADGPCGFAWINVKPAYSRVAKALVALGHAKKDGYYGGVTFWVGDYNQSMARKEAFARAFAAVLREAGINAYAASRMD